MLKIEYHLLLFQMTNKLSGDINFNDNKPTIDEIENILKSHEISNYAVIEKRYTNL